MLSVSFRRCQPSNLQSELGLNLLGAETLLWNRSALCRCLCFTFLCAAPLAQSCQRLFPDARRRVNVAWEILSESVAREATTKYSWKAVHNTGCGDGRNRRDAVRRLNLHLCGARHPFSSSFVAFWRHPKLSWGVSLMWKGFSNAAVSMFICESIFISRMSRLCAPVSGVLEGGQCQSMKGNWPGAGYWLMQEGDVTKIKTIKSVFSTKTYICVNNNTSQLHRLATDTCNSVCFICWRTLLWGGSPSFVVI